MQFPLQVATFARKHFSEYRKHSNAMRQGKHRPHYATARSRRSLRRRREVGLPGMIATLLLALAALLPNVVMAIMVGQMAGSVGYFLAQLLMGVVLLLVPLLFLPARGWLLLEGIFLLVYPLELVSLLSIGEPLNYAVFSSVLHTTSGEAIGQLRAYALPAIGYLVAMVVYYAAAARGAAGLVAAQEGAIGRDPGARVGGVGGPPVYRT